LISDFGLARLKNVEVDVGKTQTKVGPLKWEAPEAFMKRIYSRKSDVFSFGVVSLYILLI
jgi:serine/threonine protein kinase